VRVPQLYADKPGLGGFVSECRKMYENLIKKKGVYDVTDTTENASRLSPERIRVLEELGFEWSLRSRSCRKKEKNTASEAAEEEEGPSQWPTDADLYV